MQVCPVNSTSRGRERMIQSIRDKAWQDTSETTASVSTHTHTHTQIHAHTQTHTQTHSDTHFCSITFKLQFEGIRGSTVHYCVWSNNNWPTQPFTFLKVNFNKLCYIILKY